MASRRGGGGAENIRAKVYIGNLPRDASEHEVDRAFRKFGPLRNVWVARRPPGFAFVEFEDERDAEDAVQALDKSHLCGNRVRVEFSSGVVRPKGGRDSGKGGRSPVRRDRDRSRSRSPRRERCVYCHSSDHSPRDCPDRIRRRSRSGEKRSRSRSRSPRAPRKDRNGGDEKVARRKSRSRSPSDDRDAKRRSLSRGDRKGSSPKKADSSSKQKREEKSESRSPSRSRSRSASKSVDREVKEKRREDDVDSRSRSDRDDRSVSKAKSDEEDDE